LLLLKYFEEMMKKILIILLSAYLLSSCYLITEPSEPRETETTIPTALLTAVETGIPTELPAETSTPQFTATPFPFVFQSGTPAYIENYAYPLKGCDWLGIAGQVFDEDGKPLINKVVMVTGEIEEKVVEIVGVTGVPEADIYGPGGFEIQIADHVFASDKALAVQVFDLDGIPISGSIPFDTLADCGKNLIIINFQFTE
jgi:hypothetical protein